MITHRAGFYNGLNDSIGSLFRATAPLSAGAIFAASTSSADAAFPFDEHLGFFCVGLVCLLTLGLSRGIDAAAKSAKRGEGAGAGAGAIALSSTKAQIETRTGGREGGGG